ncbi:hypothetical protein [Rhizobium sp. BG4]|uniref:hypothetical protein n=1 Tax=Rhizobium sp. BG4 TaxID=2613770 RepID=UPI0032B1D829
MRGSPTPDGMAGVFAGHYRTTVISRLLHLAAAPTFGIMALLNAGNQSAMMICAGEGGPMLSGMPVMYLLMAIVHLGPWLDLLGGRSQSFTR